MVEKGYKMSPFWGFLKMKKMRESINTNYGNFNFSILADALNIYKSFGYFFKK